MDTYYVEAPGAGSLQDIESEINSEEASGAQFEDSHVATLRGQATNLVEFDDLATGHRPKGNISLVQGSGKAPAKKTRIWTGSMVVSGTIQSVTAYR